MRLFRLICGFFRLSLLESCIFRNKFDFIVVFYGKTSVNLIKKPCSFFCGGVVNE